jgi:beta-lactamase superfamily II metal-dependent hydrolase
MRCLAPRRRSLHVLLLAFVAVACPGVGLAVDAKTPEAGPFTLWQLPAQTHSQMNGYVIRTSTGKLIVIDGGTEGDAPYLRGFLGALGSHVDAWFISHAHDDHFDAVTAILNDPAGIIVDKFYGSLPDETWIAKHEPRELKPAQAFNEAVKKSGHEVTDLALGQVLDFDGVRFEILGVRNPEITDNPINNQSVVMMMSGRGKKVLFLGDLGWEGGRKLLKSPYGKQLNADYVQMAHHGQNGVEEDVYKAIAPSYCLWPTPRWLWDVDNGGGKGSGPWKTLETRAWMDKLNIQKHYVAADGLYRIDF